MYSSNRGCNLLKGYSTDKVCTLLTRGDSANKECYLRTILYVMYYTNTGMYSTSKGIYSTNKGMYYVLYLQRGSLPSRYSTNKGMYSTNKVVLYLQGILLTRVCTLLTRGFSTFKVFY